MTPATLLDMLQSVAGPLLPQLSAGESDAAGLMPILIAGGAALAVILAVMTFAMAPDSERKMRRRIERITSPNAEPKSQNKEVESVRRSTRDSSIAGLDRMIKKLLPNVDVMRRRLARSGWPLKIGDYLLVCLVLAGVTGFGLPLAVDLPTLVYVLAGIVVGAGLPHFALKRRIARRVRKFTTLLPDALDLIVRGIRSGLPASEALRSIGEEMEDPVGIEFRQVTDQMRIGVNLDDAMWTMAKKLEMPELNFLVISLSIQQETGGNLAEILEKLSEMVRRREQMRLKVRAMSSEARASAMIIGSLPFIMAGVISFVNPGYMSTLFTDPRGWVMLGVGLTSLTVGMLVMSKMVKFEI